MTMLLLLLAAALAQDPASPPLRDPAVVIEEAITLRRGGDPDGAAALLRALSPMVAEDQRGWLLYQQGVCEELAFRPAAAKGYYEQVIARGGSEALDARFRLALVLEELDEDDAALEQILTLAKQKGLDERDQVTIALQRGIAEVRTGKTRRGAKRIQAALDAVEGGETHTWMRAKGRYTLAKALLDEAAGMKLRGSEKRVVKRLKGRAERLLAAEKQIIAIATLEEPEWILAGLIDLGDGYTRLADELLAAPAPRKLSDEQEAIYREELAQKAEVLRTKAFHAWDQGVALATRIGWESPRVGTLKARRDGLAAVR